MTPDKLRPLEGQPYHDDAPAPPLTSAEVVIESLAVLLGSMLGFVLLLVMTIIGGPILFCAVDARCCQ